MVTYTSSGLHDKYNITIFYQKIYYLKMAGNDKLLLHLNNPVCRG